MATSKATNKKKKGRSTEPVKSRSKPKVEEEDVEDDEEDENEDDDVLDGSQENDRYRSLHLRIYQRSLTRFTRKRPCSIMRFFAEKLNSEPMFTSDTYFISIQLERGNKQSTKFLELEQEVKEMIQDARESSQERRRVCEQML